MIFNYLLFSMILAFNGVIFFSFIITFFMIRMTLKVIKLRKTLNTVSDFFKKLEEK